MKTEQVEIMSQTEVTTSTSVKRLGKIPQYTQVPETVHELDWADLATLDLSKFDIPGGKQELAQKLQDAVQQIGIFFHPPNLLSQPV